MSARINDRAVASLRHERAHFGLAGMVALFAIGFLSCACTSMSTSTSNFRKKAYITEESGEFRSGEIRDERYVNQGETTAQAISKMRGPGPKMNVELFEISLSDGRDSKVTKDLLYLVAAEFTVQRGFSKFIVTKDRSISGCSGGDYSTIGTISGNDYSSTTYGGPATYCSSSKMVEVLLFKAYSDITNPLGIYYEHYGMTEIYRPLYSTFQLCYGQKCPANIAKEYFEASEVIERLRYKYKIAPAGEYKAVIIKGRNESDLDALKKH